MSGRDPSTSNVQDQSQSTYSPRFCPSSPSPLPTVEICSNMQGQPQDAPESPYFTASSPSPPLFKTAASTMPPSASHTSPPPLELCSKDAAGPEFPNAGSYLMRPEIIALIASGAREPKLQTSFVSQITNHHLPLLNHESQTRGLIPRFEIEGSQRMGFGGKIKVGDQTITSEERWQTKKAAKEGLSEKAIEVVKAMPLLKRKRSAGETQKNWIGMLQHYHAPTQSTTGGPIYLEYAHGFEFACTCKIPAHPNPFGSDSTSLFSNKKAARSNAAKEAMQFLINQGLASPDGGCNAGSKKAKRDAAAALAEDTELGFAKKVNELCPLLSLPVPEYRIISSDLSLPNLYSGDAYFPDFTPHGLLPTLGPIGSVKDIRGRKAAKDQCAMGVLKFLTEWMKIQDETNAMDKKHSGDEKGGTADEKKEGGD